MSQIHGKQIKENSIDQSKLGFNIEDLIPTIYTDDSSLSSDRTINCIGYEIHFINGKSFIFSSNNEPELGESSYSIKGFGTASTTTQRFLTDLGTSHEWYGDLSQQIFGKVGIGSLVGSDSRVYIYETDPITYGLKVDSYAQGIVITSQQSTAISGVNLGNYASGVSGEGYYGVRGVARAGSGGFGAYFHQNGEGGGILVDGLSDLNGQIFAETTLAPSSGASFNFHGYSEFGVGFDVAIFSESALGNNLIRINSGETQIYTPVGIQTSPSGFYSLSLGGGISIGGNSITSGSLTFFSGYTVIGAESTYGMVYRALEGHSFRTNYGGDETLKIEYGKITANVDNFYINTSIAPSGSDASFNINGYGTIISDKIVKIESDLGVSHEWYGDLSQQVNGDMSFANGKKIYFNGNLAYIQKSGGSNGLEIAGNGGSLVVGWNGGQVRHTGNLDVDSIDTYNSNVNSYYSQADGNYRWRFGKTGNNGAIRGNITGSYIDTEIITINQVDGTTHFNIPSVGINSPSIDSSSILQIDSTTKGFLSPRMTEAEMNTIALPADGLEVINTTRGCKMIYNSFFGWTPLSISENTWWGYHFFTEMMATNSDPWTLAFTNGGTAVNSFLPTMFQTSAYGLATGVTANGESRISTGSYLIGSVGKKRTETRVFVSLLSTVSDRYTCYFGFLNNATLLNQDNAMYFLYDEGGVSTGSTASPNWICVCCSAGSRTFVDSGVVVNNQASAQPQTLRIDDDGTGTSVKFYINNTQVANITTNIPTIAVQLVHVAKITKSAGLNQRSFYIDYISLKEKFNTPR